MYVCVYVCLSGWGGVCVCWMLCFQVGPLSCEGASPGRATALAATIVADVMIQRHDLETRVEMRHQEKDEVLALNAALRRARKDANEDGVRWHPQMEQDVRREFARRTKEQLKEAEAAAWQQCLGQHLRNATREVLRDAAEWTARYVRGADAAQREKNTEGGREGGRFSCLLGTAK